MGERGKEELLSEIIENKYRMELEDLKVQTFHLASECKKALMQAVPSNDPQVLKAINLCDKFLASKSQKRKKVQNESLKSLWGTTNQCEQVDPATVLGQDLVDTITEKNKQPPDVSYAYSIIQCVTCKNYSCIIPYSYYTICKTILACLGMHNALVGRSIYI